MADKTLPDSESVRQLVERMRVHARLAAWDFVGDYEPEFTRVADALEVLAERLELDRTGKYDGIYCRDETIRAQDARIAKLEEALKEADRHLNDHDGSPEVIRRYVAGVVRRALTETK